MTQILKRLEIIKSSIAIEDEEVIDLQVMKLQKLDIDDDVKAIVTHLEAMNYAKAMKDIEAYILRYSGVVEYVDSEVQGLKLELKSLESKLQELVEQKTEYLNDIEEFNREYNLHLGELIKDILNLKKEILYKKTIKKQKQKVKYQEDIQTFQESKETIDELKSTISELEDALETIDEDDENYDELSHAYNELKEELEKLEDELELQEEELEKAKEFIEDESIEQEYEEVKSHYEEFESEYEHIKESVQNSPTLNDEEKKELKSLYKQAARLCHPDIVPDELKEKAHELMQKLNDAYSKKDISKVKEILHSLQNGTSFELSSETIEDKELLKAKIKEYLKNIEAIKSEIEEIKEDETYQTITELDDWDVYFEELRGGLEAEKGRLKEEAREVLEEKEKIEDNVLIQWAIQNNIDEILEHKNQLENIKRLRLNDKNLTHIPKEITSLSNLAELKLWKNNLVELPEEISSMSSLEVLTLSNNNLIKLPKNITQLKLKKLQLRDNKSLILTNEQIQWIKKLKENGCDFEMDKDLLSRKDIETTQEKKISKKTGVTIVKKKNQKEKEKSATITKEDSPYAKHIHSIENIKFEKIRKYCENLSKSNEADEMQKQLGKTGKMYKALIYSSLEVFIEYLNGETITLCDWGCSQGIASMLVLDYIKEKQLDIKVSDVILIDDDTKSLSRAMVQVEALAQDDIKFTPIKSDDNSISDTIKSIKNNKVINLFANDKIPTNFWTINHDIFHDSYLLCVSNENKEFVNEVYETINIFLHVQDVSIRDGNIGRFDKYERIFRTLIDIDSDEIPF
ncbi:MAG: hypothetical protein IBX44_09845 [Sulfurospirillum sp.]|nr:hypothetical protein [Sulfurospirillum sp.]